MGLLFLCAEFISVLWRYPRVGLEFILSGVEGHQSLTRSLLWLTQNLKTKLLTRRNLNILLIYFENQIVVEILWIHF